MNLRADQYVPPSRAQLDARLRQADKPGEHLWVMTAGWTITDPASAYRGDVKLMDRNNLVVFAGPGGAVTPEQVAAAAALPAARVAWVAAELAGAGACGGSWPGS